MSRSSSHCRKGIILAGGSGSRLDPLTRVVNKHLLAVYDKPLIYYPLSTLLLAGIHEIQLITTSEYLDAFKRLLGNGSRFGVSIDYAIQSRPAGIAQAFLIAERFISNEQVALILGDNIFLGDGLSDSMARAARRSNGATVFAYQVDDPERFGIVEIDQDQCPLSIIEKPRLPSSNLAVAGLYFYDNRVVEVAAGIKPSDRGELEITDVNAAYLRSGLLHVEVISELCRWIDAGTHDALLMAGVAVEEIQRGIGRRVGCPEELALRTGRIPVIDGF